MTAWSTSEADMPLGCCTLCLYAVYSELDVWSVYSSTRTTKRASERRAHVVEIPRDRVRDARRDDSADNIGE